MRSHALRARRQRAEDGQGDGFRGRCRDPRSGGLDLRSTASRAPARSRASSCARRSPRGRRPSRASTCASTISRRRSGRTISQRSTGVLPHGIMLPKARSGEDVHQLSVALGHAEEKSARHDGHHAHRRADHRGCGHRCCNCRATSARAIGSKASPGARRICLPRSAPAPTASPTARSPRPIAWSAT